MDRRDLLKLPLAAAILAFERRMRETPMDLSGLADDDCTQYFFGSNMETGNLILESTSHASQGAIYLGSSVYEES